MGVSARLFDHFSLYAYCYDFKTVAGGIRYELTPRQRVFNPTRSVCPGTDGWSWCCIRRSR